MNGSDFLNQEPVSLAIGVFQNKVVIEFPEPIRFLVLDPRNVAAIAEALCEASFKADEGLRPVGPALKASLVEKHRDILIPRIAIMLTSLREKQTVSSGQLSEQIITTVFSEIF